MCYFQTFTQGEGSRRDALMHFTQFDNQNQVIIYYSKFKAIFSDLFVLFLVFGRINIASLLLSLPYSVAPEWKSRFGSNCSAMCSCRVQPGREGVKLRVQRCAEGAYRSKVKPMICIFGRIEIHKS